MHPSPSYILLTNYPDTFIQPSPILTLIHASRETLTHIRIPEPTGYSLVYETLTQFFNLQFPCLSVLELGGWNTTVPIGAALSNFLIAHPLIEELQLYFSDFDPCVDEIHCRISSDIALDPGTLPNLRHLTTDPFNLSIFIRSGLSSLQTLDSLHIGVCFVEEQEARFSEMYRALEAFGGLPELKVLELELVRVDDELANARWIAGLGKLCPKVERFRGDYEVGWTSVSHFISV